MTDRKSKRQFSLPCSLPFLYPVGQRGKLREAFLLNKFEVGCGKVRCGRARYGLANSWPVLARIK